MGRVLGNFNAAFSSASLDFMTAMSSLGLSQVVLASLHQADHMLVVIFCAGIDLDWAVLGKLVPGTGYYPVLGIQLPKEVCVFQDLLRFHRACKEALFQPLLGDCDPPGSCVLLTSFPAW